MEIEYNTTRPHSALDGLPPDEYAEKWSTNHKQPTPHPHSNWTSKRGAGHFPDDPSLIRLVSMLVIEANDEWLVGRSYVSQHSMATLYEPARERSLTHKNDQAKESTELIAA